MRNGSWRWEIDSIYSTDAETKLGNKKTVHDGNESDHNTGDRKLVEMGCNIHSPSTKLYDCSANTTPAIRRSPTETRRSKSEHVVCFTLAEWVEQYLWFDASSDVVRAHHVTKHNTPIHDILSTAPQLSISQKAIGTVPEDGNIMPKHVGTTIHN
jgi:hypothetical protein